MSLFSKCSLFLLAALALLSHAPSAYASFITNNPLITNGLVGYWPLDEGQGTKAYDRSGKGNIGALTNMADRTPSSGWTQGKQGGALVFDGVDDYVNAGNVHAFERTSQFSVSVWAKRMATGYRILVSKRDAEISSEKGWQFGFNSSNQIEVILASHTFSNNFIQVRTSANFTDTNWHMVAFAYDGSVTAAGVKIYRDGNSADMVTVRDGLTTSIVGSDSFNVGTSDNSSGGGFFTGSLDDVRIYNRVLSASEVKRLYNGGR